MNQKIYKTNLGPCKESKVYRRNSSDNWEVLINGVFSQLGRRDEGKLEKLFQTDKCFFSPESTKIKPIELEEFQIQINNIENKMKQYKKVLLYYQWVMFILVISILLILLPI